MWSVTQRIVFVALRIMGEDSTTRYNYEQTGAHAQFYRMLPSLQRRAKNCAIGLLPPGSTQYGVESQMHSGWQEKSMPEKHSGS